ncbi:MAG: hypothetical protein LDL33_08455 [Desulfomonile sp.]|nr:hypothetical protein [Desulfomonile sp.]
MYKIEKTDYGMKFTFSGFIDEQQVRNWGREVWEMAKSLPKGFCLLMDMRGMQPLPREAWQMMEKAQEKAIKAGMKRAVQILDDPITIMQFKRFARHTGIADRERQIDVTTVPDWEKVAMDWLISGIDPDVADPAETRIMRAFSDPEKA